MADTNNNKLKAGNRLTVDRNEDSVSTTSSSSSSASIDDVTRQEETAQLNKIRNLFLAEVAKDPSRFYECDIELVKKKDWWTLRFIKWNKGNEDKALKQMVNAFMWRKTFELHDRDVNDIPREFAKVAAVFPYGEDHKGRKVIYLRVKVYRRVQQLNLFFQQFVTGIVDHVDADSGRKGFLCVFDVTDMGMTNIDFDFLQFLIQLLQNYYPYGLRYAILYNVPKFLRPMWSLAKVFLGSSVRTFAFCNSAKEMAEYIPPKFIPKYMGGESDFDFTDFEEVRNAPSVTEIGPKFGFTPTEVKKYYKMFESNILEAQKLVQGVK